jgi:beta-mannosidase
MARFFTEGKTMEQFIVGTQVAHAVGVRHALERARTRWPKSTGALYYKLNENCPAATWATVDWYGVPKISYYLIKESLSPLVAVALFDKITTYGEPLSVPVFLLDDADALKDAPWEVRVRAYGVDLKQIKEVRFPGKGSIGKVRPLGEFALDAAQTKTTPLFTVLDVMKAGVLVQRNYRFTNFEPVKDCLFNLPQTSVSIAVTGNTVEVKNTGPLPAVGVNVGRPGHLDTFTADDNYFWLDAGESKTVKVSETEGLVLGGWNIKEAGMQR